MQINIVPGVSHLDHGLSPDHIAWMVSTLERAPFPAPGIAIVTLSIPEALSPVESRLYGPTAGDAPVSEDVVSYVVRGPRRWTTRVVVAPVRQTRTLTVVLGPDGTLYTSYGGPAAPREPGDLSLSTMADIEASRAFWTVHALAV